MRGRPGPWLAALGLISAIGSLFASHGVALAAEATCPERPMLAIRDALQAADIAWAELDGDRLDRAMADLRQSESCLTEPADLALVIALHRAHARHTWTIYDPQASARAWLAVRDLSPEWTDAQDSDVPEDHPVRSLWNERQAWTLRLDEEPPGGWVVDGTPGREVPQDRAFFLQAIGKRGAVAYSSWHLTAADVPQTPWRTVRVRRVRSRGSVAAGLIAAGGLGMLGGSLAARNKILDPATPDTELLGLQQRANVLSVAGLTTVGASALTFGVLWGVKW